MGARRGSKKRPAKTATSGVTAAPQIEYDDKKDIVQEQLGRPAPSQLQRQQRQQQPQQQPAVVKSKAGEYDWLLALAEAEAEEFSRAGQEIGMTTEEAHHNDERTLQGSGEHTQFFFIGDWRPSSGRCDWADLQDSDTECQYTYTYHNFSDDPFGGERDQGDEAVGIQSDTDQHDQTYKDKHCGQDDPGDPDRQYGENEGVISVQANNHGEQKGYSGDGAAFHELRN